MKLKFDLSQVEAAAARWQKRSRRIAKDSEASVRELEPGALESAVDETPVRDGLLVASWTTERVDGGLRLRNGTRYAGYVLEGQLAARVRARIEPKIPDIQPALVRRITTGGA